MLFSEYLYMNNVLLSTNHSYTGITLKISGLIIKNIFLQEKLTSIKKERLSSRQPQSSLLTLNLIP
jgi:hypothetical protein